MKTLIIFCIVSVFVTVINGQQQQQQQQQQQLCNIDSSDVYNQMFKLARHCQSVIAKINPILASHSSSEGDVIYDSSIPLLKELQLQLISVSCETIIYGSVAGQKAALSEALNGNDANQNNNQPLLKATP